MSNDISKVVSNLYKKQKDFFASQITKTNAYRIQKLKSLRKEINARELEIHEALKQDMRKPTF
jgi:aldehyde dehydrogenase (NAD+)